MEIFYYPYQDKIVKPNFYFAEFMFDLFIILFNTSWNYCLVYNYKN